MSANMRMIKTSKRSKMMAHRVYRATEKATGRFWYYQMRRTYGRQEFRAALDTKGSWAPTLKGAKDAAEHTGHFAYAGEVLVTYAG